MLNTIPRAVGAAALLFTLAIPGQDAGDLARVVLIEEQEHDLAKAEQGYRKVAAGQGAENVRAEAFLRLGALLRKMGREEEAKGALQQAVAFKVAPAAVQAREMLQQDPQDPERKKALRQRARELIAKWAEAANPNEWWELRRNLEWVGVEAVPELVADFEAWASDMKDVVGDPWSPALSSRGSRTADLIFALGGDASVAFLERASESTSISLRRSVAVGLHTDMADPRLFEVAARMAKDADPEVARYALGEAQVGNASRQARRWLARRYPVSVVITATQHPERSVRQHAFSILWQQWDQMRHVPDPAATVAALIPILDRDLRGVDPERARDAAGGIVGAVFEASQGRRMILDHLQRLPEGFLLAQVPRFTVAEGDEHLERIVALTRRNQVRQSHAIGEFLRRFIHSARGWDRRAISFLLELDRLGRPTLAMSLRLAEADDAGLLVKRLAETGRSSIAGWLYDNVEPASLPADTWPAMKAVVVDGLGWEKPYRHFARLAARTGHRDAVQWLVSELDRKKVNARDPRPRASAYALIEALRVVDRPDVRAAVRKLVSRDDMGTEAVASAVVELLIVGDGEVAALLRDGRVASATLRHAWSVGRDWRSIPATLISPECGLDLEERMRTLRAILEQESSCWYTIAEWMAPSLNGNRSEWSRAETIRIERKPDPEAGKALLALARSQSVSGAARRALGSWALRVDDSRFEDLLNGSDSFTHMAVRKLEQRLFGEPELMERYGDRLLDIIRLEDSQVAHAALDLCLREGNGLTSEKRLRAVALGLAHPDSRVRKNAVYGGHESFTAEQFAQAILDDEICQTVCPLVPVDAGDGTAKVVAALLTAIAKTRQRDQQSLMQALDRIRVYQDQKAHWDRVFAGADASSNGAAEKLLRQADPKQKRDVRLLAIRSLGALGVPETLPFLIDWSQGDDAEIAEAALAAIEQIHRKQK